MKSSSSCLASLVVNETKIIMSALRGKTQGFENVIKLIDEVFALLVHEQLIVARKSSARCISASLMARRKLERFVSKLKTAFVDATRDSLSSHLAFDISIIMLALRGKTHGLEKVIKLIDGVVALLDQLQLDDGHR